MYFPATIHDNHLCLSLDSGDWLVDTGSPLSFGEAPVRMGNITHEVAPSFPGFSVAKLRECVGARYTGLLGVDILNRYACHFDLPGNRMGFLGEAPNVAFGDRVDLELVAGGIPLLKVSVEDRGTQRLILDTGAQYSYLNNISRDEAERIGRGTDFHPMLGRYPVEFFLKGIRVGRFSQDLQFTSQETVTQMCRLIGVDGILGLEPLRTHEMFYDARSKAIWI